MDPRFLERAVALAARSVARGGGPFGAVVVRGGTVIAQAANRVTASHDPTAHAEVRAIRAACRKLGTHQLDGCEIYSSCEPCPMCLGAIYWARLSAVYFAASREDAARAGFDD
ncbi:MAG: nucleoside deaminase, partial [Bryobacter sp.]|nr:nucleoside deaminase [Bryobacter sp.]